MTTHNTFSQLRVDKRAVVSYNSATSVFLTDTKERERDRQTERERDRQTEKERERETDRERETERQRERERERDHKE